MEHPSCLATYVLLKNNKIDKLQGKLTVAQDKLAEEEKKGKQKTAKYAKDKDKFQTHVQKLEKELADVTTQKSDTEKEIKDRANEKFDDASRQALLRIDQFEVQIAELRGILQLEQTENNKLKVQTISVI